jgi:hypothetical protein
MNYQDKSVRNDGGIIHGPVITGDQNQLSPEKPSPPKKAPRVFSSFILPAIIIALGSIVAALLMLLWSK